MKVIKILFLTSVLSLAGALHGMVSHCLLETPEHKKILIISELHKVVLPGITELLNERLMYLKAAALRSPIPFIVEMEDGVLFTEGLGCTDSIKLLMMLRSQQRDLQRKQFTIELFDPRGEYSRELDSALDDMSQILVKDFPPDQLVNYYKGQLPSDSVLSAQQQVWKSELSILRTFLYLRSITGAQYLAYLMKVEKELERMVQDCTEEPLKKIFEPYVKAYREARKECVAAFKERTKTQPLGFLLADILDSCTDTLARMKQFHEFRRIFVKGTDHLYFELSLLKRLMKLLKTESSVCIYVGYDHAQKLEKILTDDFGCTHENGASIVEYCHPLQTSLRTDLLKDLLPTFVLDSFLEPLLREACWFCKKRPEKLQQCAFCKKARYCDRDCQSGDWQKHKLSCSKVAVAAQ